MLLKTLVLQKVLNATSYDRDEGGAKTQGGNGTRRTDSWLVP